MNEPRLKSDSGKTPDGHPVVLLVSTIADTTWRMFLPTIGLMLLGLMADKELDSFPWVMLAGLALGSWLAWHLVKKQLQQVRHS